MASAGEIVSIFAVASLTKPMTTIILKNGFSVAESGRFAAAIDPLLTVP